MKTPLLLIPTLLFSIVVFSPDSPAQNVVPERTVRLIYFLPQGATPQPDIDERLNALIKDVQHLYANEMERHGHGRKTFSLETQNNTAVVHHVTGQFATPHYHQHTFGKITAELAKQFNASRNVYLIMIELASDSFENGDSCGIATLTHGDIGGGYALIPATGHCVIGHSGVALAAHELGHTFGLLHDFSSDIYIMSYGRDRRVFSACAADWLSVHPYFTAGSERVDRSAVIEMLKAEAVSPDAIRFHFNVKDPDGLHQAQLDTNTTAVPGAIGHAELLACQPLNGEADSTFDLVTTKLTVRDTSEVGLRVIDVFGNTAGASFPIQDFSVTGPKIEGPWLWTLVATGGQGGAAAAVSGKDYLSEATDAAVTELAIATHGATAGDPVGNTVWTRGTIAPIGKNNLEAIARLLGSGLGAIDRAVIYGSLKLNSPKQQKTLMFAGSDDAVKVWLNGELVHDNPIDRAGADYQDFFFVTLKAGENILLVAVYENTGEWSGFFGFHKDTVYTVMNIEGNTVAAPKTPGPKIEGPWLWMIAPTKPQGGAHAAASGIDWLALASGGSVTEKQIAENGATAGDPVGNKVWTLGKLAAFGENNINDTMNAIGLGSGNIENAVAYGYVAVESPKAQNTTMYVGSDDAVKVWLNGKLIHDNPIDRGATDYQEAFPVTLKHGTNLLFVAIYEFWGGWSGFFGFENRTAYRILRIPVAHVSASQRPSFYWIDNGMLHRLVGTKVENLVPSVQNATRLAVDVLGDTLYWIEQTDDSTGRIRRAPLDGSTIQLVKNLTSVPLDITLDTAGGKLYVTNAWGKVQRLNLDGSNFQPNLITGLQKPNYLALDVRRGKVYWTEQTGDTTGKIQRANLDGTNVQLIKELTSAPRGIALDTANRKLYLANAWGKVQRLNFDGSNFQPNLITALDAPESVAVDTVGGKIYWTELGKIRRADLTGGNSQDVVTGLGQPTGAVLGITAGPTPIAAAPAVAARPHNTVLLANYPNPFNPETWIPYTLAAAADVTLMIYDARGIVVRRLALGHQSAGRYTQQSRAAYWDGRNTLGESVASGIYFYQLHADTISPMRKMVILK